MTESKVEDVDVNCENAWLKYISWLLIYHAHPSSTQHTLLYFFVYNNANLIAHFYKRLLKISNKDLW